MASVGAWVRGGLAVLLACIFLLAVVRRPHRHAKREAKRAARAAAEALTGSGVGAAGAAGAALLLGEEEPEKLKERAEQDATEDSSGLTGAAWKAAKEEEDKKKFGFWKFVILLHACGAAYCYRTYRRHSLGERTAWATQISSHADADFRYGPWEVQGCLSEDRNLLLCSCCCLCVQWADTLSSDKLRLGRFWPLLIVAATFIIGGMKVFQPHFLFVLMAVYFRQQIRAAYGLPFGTPQTYITDCLLWCCCAPCAAMQEARQVEHVPLSGKAKSGPSHPHAELFGVSTAV